MEYINTDELNFMEPSDEDEVHDDETIELNDIKNSIYQYIQTIDDMMNYTEFISDEISTHTQGQDQKCLEMVKLIEKNTVELKCSLDEDELFDENYDEDLDEDEEIKESWCEQLSEEDILEIDNFIIENIEEYLDNDILNMSHVNFHESLVSEITSMVCNILNETHHFSLDNNNEEVEMYVNGICKQFFENTNYIPPRSYSTTFINHVEDQYQNRINIDAIEKILEYIKNKYQPEQRTTEWYEYRHKLLTASNIWKVFGSDAVRNQLICEKCKPYQPHRSTNIQSPLHWGQKYEPISIQLYEHLYSTKVADFGCIVHDKYDFIGASPDGINISKDNGRYGRMIEVKNIVNREINGIPKEEYWIQMQLQMETCDLEECDFIETRFKEYNNKDEFIEDNTHDYKGVILSYYNKHVFDLTNIYNVPMYIYSPISLFLKNNDLDCWIAEQNAKYSGEFILYKEYYWYLDEYSCVLVKRNKAWFQKAIPHIIDFWNIIVKEKEEGYDHRLPKKKYSKIEVTHDDENTKIHNMTLTNNICLIKLDENGNVL
jgi:putative phage-type endonuclease